MAFAIKWLALLAAGCSCFGADAVLPGKPFTLGWKNSTNCPAKHMHLFTTVIESTTNVVYSPQTLAWTTNQIILQWAKGDEFNGRLMTRLFVDVMGIDLKNLTPVTTGMLSGWTVFAETPADRTNLVFNSDAPKRFFRARIK